MPKLIAGERQIDLSTPACMGIINATPDSFSDGSRFQKNGHSKNFQIDLDKVLRVASAMVSEGAQFIDVGGESTRPGANPVSLHEELDRVIPVIEALHSRFEVNVSVDTSSPEVMVEAIDAGAIMINDVRALGRSGTLDAAINSNAAVCLMHMQGQPLTMQDDIAYTSVTDEVYQFLKSRIKSCVDGGIDQSRLLVDPGFGFGKTQEHNYQLLRALPTLAELGLPILVGLSRKSMIGGATGRPVDQRVAGSVAATMLALTGGANIIRTHDVAATLDAIRVHCAYLDA